MRVLSFLEIARLKIIGGSESKAPVLEMRVRGQKFVAYNTHVLFLVGSIMTIHVLSILALNELGGKAPI